MINDSKQLITLEIGIREGRERTKRKIGVIYIRRGEKDRIEGDLLR